ncbi:MAG: pitrilysin family protein [Anaerolineae bacterium]|uniref:M16 family metallopeptidase n=1 Tax=Candidatus Amarolinea dominans TaxID=3140696 RepID=UPI001D1EE37D|nr:insulinase family protein [Anaerolineae bacterium]MBK7201518.1 insulinase family protein [Anaerolineae bacterium]MBK9092523.1 insulinase family protein [Anaerolineae bacterium]MBK9231511.1 insulinase family protein [Anaerolineae bacterium]
MTTNHFSSHTLANGLQILIQEMHHAPVASLWVWYRVGSRNERPGLTGASHWVEHMLFRGTERFPSGAVHKLVAREGGTRNGFTSLDFTAYFETLPADRIELALQLESDRMLNARFAPEDVEAERTIIISERAGHENSPGFLLDEAMNAAAFSAHPYGHTVLGSRADLTSMTRDDLWQHYRTFYAPNNAIAVVVGDVDSDAQLARITELFSPAPAAPAPVPLMDIQEPAQTGMRRVTVEGDSPVAYVELAFRAPTALHPDFFALTVLDAILSGAKSPSAFGGEPLGRSARIYRRLVDSGLAAGAGSYIRPSLDPHLFSFYATVRAGQAVAAVEDALWALVDEAAAGHFTTSEVEKAIKQARAQFAYGSESITQQAYWLGFSAVVASSAWLSTYLDQVSRVTVEEVRRVAAHYLRRDQCTAGHYLPRQAAH